MVNFVARVLPNKMFRKCCGCTNKKNKKEEVNKEGDTETDRRNSDSKRSGELRNEDPESDTKGNDTKDEPATCSVEESRDKMRWHVPDSKMIARAVELLLEEAERKENDAKDEMATCSVEDGRDKVRWHMRDPKLIAARTIELLAEEEERGTRSRLPAEDDVDTETSQSRAVERGMMPTPHPAKRGSGGIPNLAAIPQWLSQEDDDIVGEGGGTAEPPATPVGRDELALRRHRFFSDLLQAHQAGTEHRVRFDPLGPTFAGGEYLGTKMSVIPWMFVFGKCEV